MRVDWGAIRSSRLDIDHCLPWSAWSCGDLWNLMPAIPRVNQHMKRDKLPSCAALAAARDEITGWWEMGWLADAALAVREIRGARGPLTAICYKAAVGSGNQPRCRMCYS